MSVSDQETFDLLVIGGGINGVGIARDAAGRGLRVALCERGDLGGETSSASSKLIHGGLRYLEHLEIRLVREALEEREIWLRNAPHLVRPLRFVMPYALSVRRPPWLIWGGLWLYDHLSRRTSLPASKVKNIAADRVLHTALKPDFPFGFTFSDCQVDDARLVVAVARSAAEHGARVLVRTHFAGASVTDNMWWATLEDRDTGEHRRVSARVLVNAAGPWVSKLLESVEGAPPPKAVRLVKGSHIVVPRLYEGENALMLMHSDKRVVFVIPFEERFSLIGTTDVDLRAPESSPAVTPEEITYLCTAVSRYLARPIDPRQIVWSYAGTRTLVDGGRAAQRLSRDYVLDFDTSSDRAPLLSVCGGKVTTHRRLAEKAVEQLRIYFPGMGSPWTASAPLPGGNLPEGGVDELVDALELEYAELPGDLLRPLARRHGTRVREVLGSARTRADLGEDFGAGLIQREVDYFVAQEWARTAEDVLWRRTKAGLRIGAAGRERLDEYLKRTAGRQHPRR